MLQKFFGKTKEKFAMELTNSPEQESNAVFAPPIAEQTETPAAVEGEESAAPAAPAAAPATPSNTYVDPIDLITAAVKEASVEMKAATEAASVGSFADQFLVTAGNKSDRRRPGKSMAAFMGMSQSMNAR